MNWRLYGDIGNQTLHWGIYGSDRWLATDRVVTSAEMEDDCIESLAAMMRQARRDINDYEGGLMCSSAPDMARIVQDALDGQHGIELPEMGPSHRDCVSTEYRDPSQLGADRIANAAATKLYGDPCVVIDVGTCITAEVVVDGVLKGGAIAPGLPVMKAGLIARTPHLGKLIGRVATPLNMTEPAKTTERNLVLGMFTALIGSVEVLARNMMAPLQDAELIMTGGWAEWVCQQSTMSARVDPMLTLRGLRILDERV